jgi:hypothetical protein
MNSPELEVIPVIVKLKYLLLSTPTSLRYFIRCLIGLVKGKPIYKRVRIGDKFTSFDGTEYEYVED